MSDNNGWLGKPGGPPKSEYRGWHWLYLYNGIPCPAYWDGYWLVNGSRIQAEDLDPQIKYWGECLTPAEVDARIATARKDGMKDAAKWHEVRSIKLSGKARVARNFRQLLRQSDFHMESAAAIRALKGEGND
jgi:hypothetical protein